ncbi:NAD(P)H-binding protein [Lacticaseibacillus parakribbianus]|uniref:NAD(P)H-binding protein n=1 Tax=Lacticaseibacillus parakribbianus TaxID=2970927 RepID=UPI0021CAFECC|nr:NAD(P)H-binding protein [Lacticaseibacillus parakribbianus]
MTTYALTGATGRFGQTAAQTLVHLVGADHVVALARNVERATSLLPAGVTVRPGDYTDRAQLTASLQGVDRLLFISSQPGAAVPRLTQHENLVAAAKAAGVGFIAYTSFPHADTATTPLAADHAGTEQAIVEAGLAHAFLRNNWYLENESHQLQAAAAGKPFVYAGGDGLVGWALESDYAEAAARVLVDPAPRAIYEFAGAPHTYAELAAAVPGDFQVSSLTADEYAAGLRQAGMSDANVAVMGMLQALIRDNQLAETTTDLPTVLGRSLAPLAAAVQTVLGK